MFVGDDRKRNFKWELKSDSWCNTSQKHRMSKKPFSPGPYVSDARYQSDVIRSDFLFFPSEFYDIGWIFFLILFYQYYIFAVLDKNLVSCVTFKRLTRRMILRVTPPSARPPACSPCWSLPGQAVKRAVPSGRRSRRDGSVWAALSPPLIPPPPHSPPPTRAWLMWPRIVFQEDHWDHWVACCFKG